MRCSCRRRSPAQAGCSLLATGHGTALPAGMRSTVSSKHKKDRGASRGAVRQQPLTPCWLAGEACDGVVCGHSRHATRPCRKSFHMPTALACGSRSSAHQRASRRKGLCNTAIFLYCRARGEAKEPHVGKASASGFFNQFSTPTPLPTRGESPRLEDVSSLKLEQ